MSKPINAYSMSEFESLNSGNIANFGRGKDKTQRHRRAGMYAGIGAGALAGAGAIGAGIRYGGAELGRRSARKKSNVLGEAVSTSQTNLNKARKKAEAAHKYFGDTKTANAAAEDAHDAYTKAYGAGKANARVMRAGGAKGQLSRDYNSIRNSKVGGSILGALDKVKYGAKNTARALKGGYRTGSIGKGLLGDGSKWYSNLHAGRVGGGLVGATRAGLGTTGGKVAAGIGAAGLLGGAGYAAYKAMKKRKNK